MGCFLEHTPEQRMQDFFVIYLFFCHLSFVYTHLNIGRSTFGTHRAEDLTTANPGHFTHVTCERAEDLTTANPDKAASFGNIIFGNIIFGNIIFALLLECHLRMHY